MSSYLELAEPVADVANLLANVANPLTDPVANVADVMADPVAEWPTVAQAAAALGASPRTVRRWVGTGRLRAVRVTGKGGEEFRIDPASLASLRLLGAGRILGQPPGPVTAVAGVSDVANPVTDVTDPLAEVADPLANARDLETSTVAALLERLAAADQREADLRQLLAAAAADRTQLLATNATLAAALEREQLRRMPWAAVSEPVLPTGNAPPRRWWQWWRG